MHVYMHVLCCQEPYCNDRDTRGDELARGVEAAYAQLMSDPVTPITRLNAAFYPTLIAGGKMCLGAAGANLNTP